MKFVDLDSFDLIEILRPYCSFGDCCDIEDEIEKKIVDAVSVVHAKWIKIKDDTCYWYECSNCNEEVLKNRHGYDFFSCYCPNCGAKMDGE